LFNRLVFNELLTYFIIKNCKSRHNELLAENNINLLCREIKFLSMRSFIFTIEVSINKVTINAAITIRNFLWLNDDDDFSCLFCTLTILLHIVDKAEHNLFV